MLTLHKIAKRALIAAPPLTLTVTARHFTTPNPNPNPNPDFSTNPSPSAAHYDDLINTAGRIRDFATVRRLLTERNAKGCYNTSKTFQFLASDISSLDDLLASLADLDGNWFVKKHAHDSLVSHLARTHRVADALRVAEATAEKNYGATRTTFYPIINALTRKKDFPGAWNVFDVMRKYKIQPDTTAFNYILTAYCYVGDLGSAAEVLAKMEEERVGADARTYDALVLGACRAGRIGAALWVVRRMVEDGVQGLYGTHSYVITAMVKRGCVEQAVEYVRGFAGRDKKWDAENFGYLARRLRVAKRVEEAKMVVEEMVRRGLPVCDELVCIQNAKSKRNT